MLNKIGFEWSLCTNEIWKTRYDDLVSYVIEFGNANVPYNFPQNPSLGRWVSKQRTRYNKFKNGNELCGITTYQIQLLNNIGFEWKVNNIHRTVSGGIQYKDSAINVTRLGNEISHQELSEIHHKNAGLTRKEEVIKVQNTKISCGRTK